MTTTNMTTTIKPTFPQFDRHVCVGDSVSCTIDGIEYTARLEYDDDTQPTDFDCYDDEQFRAWRDDEWRFVAIVISAVKNGVPLGDPLACLGGCECGLSDGDGAYLTQEADNMLDEAREAAEARIAEIKAALA